MRKRWLTFGTHKVSAISNEDKLWNVLSRNDHLDVLSSTLDALEYTQPVDLTIAAILCDANVLLRLPVHSKHDQVMDYLKLAHKGPISIPGQVFQELWNNHVSVSKNSGERIKSKFSSFREEVRKEIGSGELLVKLENLFDEFITQNSSIFAEKWIENLNRDLIDLKQLATIRFVDRHRFASLAAIRKSTRTPPGFKDDAYGDFFIWADGLLGVLDKLGNGQQVKDVIVLTEEKKADWITKGRPHPVLIAEVVQLFGARLTLCDIADFAKLIDNTAIPSLDPED